MSKYRLLSCLLILASSASVLNAEDIRYASLGFGNYGSNHENNGFQIMSDIGLKNQDSKKYLRMHNINFNKNGIEKNIFSWSLNYDYSYYQNEKIGAYIGAGINYFNLDTPQNKNQNKIGSSAELGVTYDLNHNIDFNVGMDYLYIGDNDIKNSYGMFFAMEFNL